VLRGRLEEFEHLSTRPRPDRRGFGDLGGDFAEAGEAEAGGEGGEFVDDERSNWVTRGPGWMGRLELDRRSIALARQGTQAVHAATPFQESVFCRTFSRRRRSISL
jgi:hypothetical protein